MHYLSTKVGFNLLICSSYSKKDSGRAGPERGVLYKPISRIFDMLLESYSIICQILNSVACVGLTYLYAV